MSWDGLAEGSRGAERTEEREVEADSGTERMSASQQVVETYLVRQSQGETELVTDCSLAGDLCSVGPGESGASNAKGTEGEHGADEKKKEKEWQR